MREPKASAHWRDSARQSKLWIFDSTAAFPLLVLIFHITWETFSIAIGFMFFLKIIGMYGFKIPVFLRFIRSLLAGKRKLATPWWM